MRWAPLLALLLLLVAPSLARADIDSGLQAFQAGNYPLARRELLPLQADPRAAYALAVMAENGWGMPRDLAAAVRLYTTAVRGGNVAAMVNLGLIYDIGLGVPRNGYLAQQLFAGAARGNDTMGENNLAYLWGRQNGLLDEALCLSAKTIAAQPHNAYFIDTYGFVLLRLKRLDDAQRFFEKALKEKPDYAVAMEHLGDIARLRGDDRAAQAWWRRAWTVADRPDDAARLKRKLAGQPDDLDAHPPFRLDSNGFGHDCAMPSV
jgi:TPR repeat protein